MPGTTYERPRVLRLRIRGARRLHTVSHADERLPRSRRATASRASTGRRRGRACDLGRHVRGALRPCFSSRAAVELPTEPLAWTRGFSEVPRVSPRTDATRFASASSAQLSGAAAFLGGAAPTRYWSSEPLVCCFCGGAAGGGAFARSCRAFSSAGSEAAGAAARAWRSRTPIDVALAKHGGGRILRLGPVDCPSGQAALGNEGPPLAAAAHDRFSP